MFNLFLLISTSASLIAGIFLHQFWILGGVIGLIPAIAWVINDVRRRELGSDVLAVFSLAGTLATKEYAAASVVALMLATGRVLESWAEGQAERQLKSLIARMPRAAHKVSTDGGVSEIQVSAITKGDLLLIRSGEITPVDGIARDIAVLDESALTGEPLPATRASGSEISSGVVNAGAPFHYEAASTAEASTYAGIIRLVQSAQSHSAPGIRIANRWAARFVPFALVIAAGAWIITGDVTRAVAVLVAATPCPLILAVPISIVAGLSLSAKNGAIVKGGATLELLARAETVLLDKTGTLTHGGPEVTEINTAPGVSDDEVLLFAASLDQYSPHIVAQALVKCAQSRSLQLTSASEINEVAGENISGIVDSKEITVGQLKDVAPSWLHFSYPLMVGVTINGTLQGVIGLADPVRPESREMVSQLRAAGIKRVALVTGDRDESAQEVGAAVGITEIHSEISAPGKLEITLRIAAEKIGEGSLIVVGDGINDAPALAAADVGVAMGARGASAASEAADVVIVEDSIDRLTRSIRIAQKARAKALQSAAIGMALSAVVMATGACGITDAPAGAIAQECIDVVAILWALTTLRVRPE
jgi:heavy metal translocating P-type ATPase